MNRRDFLKSGAVLAGASALSGCFQGKRSESENESGMTYRTCPKSGDKVSLLGYGCMRWPSVNNSQDKNAIIDQEQVNRLVDKAIESGVNYFDTAPMYCNGKSETITGIALSRHRRDEYFIATKLSNFKQSTWDHDSSMEIYRNSFRELQVDYIDYYLLHGIGGGNGMETFNARFVDNGMLEFLLKEREEGRIRNLGFSFHGDVTVFDYLLSLHKSIKWDFVQIQMNYVDWNHAAEINARNVNAEYLYSELARLDIPVIIMEPLLGGSLAKLPGLIEKSLLSEAPHSSIASWAFRFCGSFPKVLTVLSGMTYMEHLDDNLKTYSPLKPLSDKDKAMLSDIAERIATYPSVPCTACGYCMPCPYRIDIPGVFAHYNKCVKEGSISSNTADPEYRKLRRRYLSTYAKAVEDARQADKCISCGQCLFNCPQEINIPEELRKIDIFVENLRREDGRA